MVRVEVFGALKAQTKFTGIDADVKTIPEACAVLAENTNWNEKIFRKCIFVLNGEKCRADTPLKDGDTLTVIAPSGGG